MISDTTTSARYIVTNGVLGYSIPFRIYTEADVSVFWSADARADTKLTLGTHYTVTILTEGGTVNLLPGVVPVGAILAVVSNVPATQEADFSSTSTVNTEALERQLDRQVQMIQQLEDSVARSVILPATSSETPQDVLDDVFAARDRAETAAASATASQTAAAASATKSAAHSLLAEQSRGQACQCADRAEQARDVAIQQTAAINVVMATEAAKINTIIATNKDDQAAAITTSRAWSETGEDVPVDTNAEGNPEYSAKHWALKSAQLLAGNASKTHKGVMQVGSGLKVEDGVVSVREATLSDMAPDTPSGGDPVFISAKGGAVTTTPTPYAVPQAGEDGEIWGLAKRDMNNITKTGTTAIAHYASPSVSGRIAVAGPATSGGKTVPMPSSGWLQGYGPSSSVGGNIGLQTYSQVQQSASAPNVGYSCLCSINVAKGEQVTVSWYGMSSVTLFFTPDKGAN